jgi:hypothetical protein
MTCNLSTAAARRTATFALVALALTAALPKAGFAATSEAGTWKVDPTKSKFAYGSATLNIHLVEGASPAAGEFIVVSKGNVYLMTGAAGDSKDGAKPVDYTNMSAAKGVLIGTNARTTNYCLSCQYGAPQTSVTLTFKAVDATGKQINDMIAFGGPKQ